jgi:ribonuclease VapC
VIVDSSVLIALIAKEDDSGPLSETLDSYRGEVRLSAANYLESGIVADSPRDPRRSALLDEILDEMDIEIVPVTMAQAKLARQAYRDFGRGSGHPAKLNFGDCFAYALATDRNEPLLFKGNDFTHTGIRRA